jgi:hypothetical protein
MVFIKFFAQSEALKIQNIFFQEKTVSEMVIFYVRLAISNLAVNCQLFIVTSVHIKFRLNDKYTGCPKIREFRIQSVVRNHFSSPNMEIKKNRDSPHKDTLV